jgi:hypothetical protein
MMQFVSYFVAMAFVASLAFMLLIWLFSIAQPWAPAFLYPDILFREKTSPLPSPYTAADLALATTTVAWENATLAPAMKSLPDTTGTLTPIDSGSMGSFGGAVFSAAAAYALYKLLRRVLSM